MIVAVSSNNPVLLPAGGLVLAGTGTTRTIRATSAPNAYGSATITLAVADSDGAIVRTTFFLTVTPVNDPPVSSPESYVTGEDTPLSVPSTSGVLANDSDVEADRLSAVLDQGPDQGSLTLRLDGSFL